MNIHDRAKRDTERQTGDVNKLGISILFISPLGVEASIVGVHSKHHLSIDTEGNAVNSKTASIAFSEKQLTDKSFPVRNAKEEVNLTGCKVEVKDSTQVVKKYMVKEFFPDETVGYIVCILEDYE